MESKTTNELARVDVMWFPKKCPKCKSMMRTVTKMSMSWYECIVDACGYRSNYMKR